ncbi:MAG: hypothetical protein JJE09_02745 [Bacteroidia bacterium]|nr:hypothetical protein [Bacteroidia bacterium]
MTAGLLTISVSLIGQTAVEKAAVMQPINKLFNGMKLGDSSKVHEVFASTVTMATIAIDKSGKPAIRYESTIEGFLKAIGTPHPDEWSEIIWDAKIEIDGNMAQVWAPYAFYVGKKFSHCGVDAFHLFNGPDGGWKIFHLADTRQKEGCNVPKEISKHFN